MLRFTNTPQEYPSERAAEQRARDFGEIYESFAAVATQAERCSQCGIPFCQIHCPLQNNIPDWLKLAAEGRMREAYEISSATNTFPEICGRICPQDRLCEGNCVIEKDFGAVTIGAVEKTITDLAFAEGWVTPVTVARESSFSVGIIGAGPAGLAAADRLRRLGHAVTVYDRYDRAGGLMVYGIPNFKLDKSIVARREQLLRESGIAFMLNTAVGENMSLQEIRARHDAVLIATGVYKPRGLGMTHDNAANVLEALEYLTQSNKANLSGSGEPDNAANKHVVVIGGGDTAMDCVRTAVRQGAASVTCLYRRDRANMPGSAREVKHAEAEGVRFEWLSAPAELIGSDKGVRQIVAQRMRLSPPDASGRQSPVPIEGDTFTLPCDLVIKALGFDAENLPSLWNEPQLKCSAQGTLSVDPTTFATALDGVYAAGDIVRGASLVVWAIRDGRDAADAIHQHLFHRNQRAA